MKLHEQMQRRRAHVSKRLDGMRREFARYLRGAGLPRLDIRRWLAMDLKELGPQLKGLWLEGRNAPMLGGFRLQEVARWPRLFRHGVLLGSFVLVLFCAALLWWPESSERLTLQRQEAEALKRRYVQMSTQSRMKPVFEQQILALESQFGDMLEKIPASLETVQVLQQISRAARDSGLRLQWFKPLPEIQEDAYAVLPVDIRLVGSYHAVGRFLEAVSHMKHLITVDVLMTSDSASPGELVLATRLKAYRGDATRRVPSPGVDPATEAINEPR